MSRETTAIYLIRHGETEWNVERRIQGWGDSPLTALGRQQALDLGSQLADVPCQAIYASTSQRAIDTAHAVRGQRDLPLALWPELRELGFGPWEGQASAELEQRDAERFHAFWNTPLEYTLDGAETLDALHLRVQRSIGLICAQHPGQTVFVVTHTVFIKMALLIHQGRSLGQLWDPPYIHPASHRVITCDSGFGQSFRLR